MRKFYVFPTPPDAHVVMRHDYGWEVQGNPDTAPDGREGQAIIVPAATPDMNGAELTVSAPGKVPANLRGVLAFAGAFRAYLMSDDYRLQDQVVCPECPDCPDPDNPPDPDPGTDANPLALVTRLAKGADLTTKEGCGKFTEACCTGLHTTFSELYGHIKKVGAQNQFNGHAVDAVNLLQDHKNPDGTITRAGIYDLVVDSESANAKPSFNYKGDPAPDLWYYPAAPLKSAPAAAAKAKK